MKNWKLGLRVVLTAVSIGFYDKALGQIDENFDTQGNWTCSGSCTGYSSHSYSTSGSPVSFTSSRSLRQTPSTQDAFPATRGSSAYAWRLEDANTSSLTATIPSGGVGTFSVYVRRWDSSPDPNYTVEYSINNGTSWTSVQTINNAWLGSSDWKQVSGTINTTNGSGSTDDIIIRIIRNSGERLMVDDFSMTTYTSSTTTYYSKSTGNLNTQSTWGTNTDGTGTSPTDFTTAGQTFNIRNNATPTIGANWTVSGSGSKVVVGDGTNACNFTIPSSFSLTGTVDVSANATLTIQNATNPTLGTLASSSTVNYARSGSQTIAAANYSNLTISGNRSSATITLASGTIDVSGSFSVTATGVGSWSNTGNTVNFSSGSSQDIPAMDYRSITNTGNGARVLASNGTIKISSTLTAGSGIYTVTGSTVEYNGTGSISIPVPSVSGGGNYHNLTFSGSSGTKTFSGGCNISGTLNISGGNTVLLNNTTTVRTFDVFDFTMSAGVLNTGSVDVTPSGPSSIVNFTGTFDKTGGTTANTSPTQVGRFVFNAGGTQLFSLNSATTDAYLYISTFVQNNTTLALFSNFVSTLTTNWLTVDAGSAIDAGTYLISTTTTSTNVTINGTIKTANISGFSGTTSSTFRSTNNPNIVLGNSSIIEYNGSSNQTVSARSDYASITINNSTGCTLGGNTTFSGTLALTTGKLTIGANTLIANGSFSGPSFGSSSSNYIIATSTGTIQKTISGNAFFPLGTITEYMPCQLNGTGTFNLNISVTSPGLTNPSQALSDQWNITGSGTLGMNLQWPTNVFGTTAYLLKYDGSSWSEVGGPVTADGFGPLTANFTGISCCSGFTVGGEFALPVELVEFKAKPIQGAIVLDWLTASEYNNAYFSIEKSLDGQRFKEIGTVAGNGTSNQLNDYNFDDYAPHPGLNYYRLRQVDFDGNFEYSKLVSVRYGERKGQLHVFPNLVTNQLTLQFEEPSKNEGELVIVDLKGSILISKSYSPGTTRLELGAEGLAKGTYFVKVFSEVGLVGTSIFFKQ